MFELLKSSIRVIISLTLLPLCLLSQPAPDFTITDTDGQVHRLYQDYLNQGKTVMVKIFFVNCPPCRAIAPSVQDLYVEWGEGNHDVEFFEFSNKSFDSNSDVAQYKNLFGLSFPGAGEDGGALTALQPYLSGTYGLLFGTPSFFVIAPDGTVTWDVRFNDMDQALLATGAQKPGTVMEEEDPAAFNFIIEDAFGNELSDVDIFLGSANSSQEFPISPGISGIFEIEDLATEFPGLTNPVVRVRKTDEVQDKLSAIDILIIVRHILGLIPIDEPELLMAADTNGDGNINAVDLITLQRVILGLINNFPNSDSYMFIPEEIPIDPLPGELQNLNFTGIKIGDLNGF
jgi:thiol-disulfide isomerase/thioredoxin